jgi:oligo-1,6-glucosidase
MDQFMKRIEFESRDNARTPFQWDDSKNAGFSTGNPWIQVGANYKTINRAAQEKDPQSVLNYFRKITALRKNNPALVYGKYSIIDKDNPVVYSYTREYEGKKFLVMLNFSDRPARARTGLDFSKAKLVLSNYKKPSTNENLAAYEALVYQLR